MNTEFLTIEGAVLTKCSKEATGKIIIPEGVSKIGEGAFWGCSSLTEIIIPDSVAEIGKDAFLCCTSLTDIVIPKGVTDIRWGAFAVCKSLTTVVIPESVTWISPIAFNDCASLESIVVDSNNKVYDSRNNCNAIIHTESNTLVRGCKNTIIPDSVTEIGEWAFRGCTSLTEIVIPESVTEIGEGTFSSCTLLESIVVDPNNKIYDSRENSNAIICTESNTLITGCKNTIIPDSVTEIGDVAFEGCTSLTDIVIPESVTEIGVWAFDGCESLKKVSMPERFKGREEEIFGCDIPAEITYF